MYHEPRFGSWVLTRFDDVYGVLRDHETFSSARGISPGINGGGGTLMITSDPPRHTHLRGVVNKAFTPQRVAALRPRIQQIVDELLAGVGNESVDAVALLTYPLPVIVIAGLLGIPPTDRERFKRWSSAVVGFTDTGMRGDNTLAVMEMMQYFAGVIAQRRTALGDDLISAIVAATIDGERLSDRELLAFCLLLLVAGNETTTNLIGNMLNVLVERPDLWTALRDNRALVPAAVEETLRYDSPVLLLWRTATRPVEIRGTPIAENEKVMVVYAAANRDPDAFPEPDEFRLDRGLSRHVAFGYGIHYCLGAPLARLEAEVALNELLDRFARVERGDGPGERLGSGILRGFKRLPLRFLV